MKKLLIYAVVTIIIVLFNSSCKKDSNNPFAPTVFTVTETATTVTYAGKTYHKVTIDSHVWLKENLNVGTMINGSQHASNNGTIEKYCYNDDPANCTAYGGLYQWDEAMQYVTTPGTKGICPTGWHIPTNAEFQTLGTTVSNDGNALKAVGQGITDPSQGDSGAGTNTSGFSALLAGYRIVSDYFFDLGGSTFIWSSTEDSATNDYYMALGDHNSKIYFSSDDEEADGFSVRCAKD